MSEEEYQNRKVLQEFFKALFEYAKKSPEAMKKASDTTLEIIKIIKETTKKEENNER